MSYNIYFIYFLQIQKDLQAAAFVADDKAVINTVLSRNHKQKICQFNAFILYSGATLIIYRQTRHGAFAPCLCTID